MVATQRSDGLGQKKSRENSMNEFDTWCKATIPNMALELAKCQDAKKIEEVLLRFNNLWEDEAMSRVNQATRTAEFARKVNTLNG